MARLLTFLMILVLTVTQGTSMAAAVCRHQNVEEHIVARESRDARIAAVATGEEAAAAVAANKASQSGDLSGHWPADLLPPAAEAPPLRLAERLRLRPSPGTALASAVVPPLLEPPSA